MDAFPIFFSLWNGLQIQTMMQVDEQKDETRVEVG